MQDEEEDANLILRLCMCFIHTMSEMSQGRHPSVCSLFKLPVSQPPSFCLKHLRSAASARLAYLINASPEYETYSIGVPPTIRALHEDPQWWVGLSRAEMRAGMSATQAEVRKAQQEIDKESKKKEEPSKTKRMATVAMGRKLIEGLKRQVLNLPMEGNVKKKDVDKAFEELIRLEADLESSDCEEVEQEQGEGSLEMAEASNVPADGADMS